MGMNKKSHLSLFCLAAVAGFCFSARNVIPVEEDIVLRAANVTLELKLKKDVVIRGESVPFEAVFANNGDEPASMDEINPSSDAFHILLKKAPQSPVKGSFKDPFVKTGGIPVRQEDIPSFLLNPKQTKSVTGDLLNIFSDLQPGNYKVTAYYKSSGGVDAKSKEIPLSVQPADIIYAFSQWEYDRVAESNLKTVWVNKGNNYSIFYTENNLKNPEVVESSYKVWESNASHEVRISSVNDYMQKRLHLLWRGKNGFYYLKINEAKADGEPRYLEIPVKGFKELAPAFTDRNGNLYVFVSAEFAKNRNTVLAYKVTDSSSKPEKIKLAEIKGPIGRYSLVVDNDSKVYFACDDDGKISYFVYDLTNKSLDGEVRTVENIPGRIVDLVVAQQFKTEKGKNANFIYYMVKAKGQPGAYTGYLLEVGTTEPKWYPNMSVFYPQELSVKQSVIDTFLRPYYLLQTQGIPKTFYKAYFSIDLDNVLPPEKEPKALCTFPQILLSSSLGDRYSVWLRYVKDRQKIVFKELEDLKK